MSSISDDGPHEQPVRVLPAIVPATLALIAETAMLAALAGGRLAGIGFLAAHLVISGLLVVLAAWKIWFRRDARLDVWLAWSTLVSGPLGPAMVIGLCVLLPWFNRSARPFEEWYAGLFPDEDQDAADRLYERIVSGREEAVADTSSLASLTDILLTGSTRAKQAVVALLARRFRSDFAPALAMALSDPEPTVRVQAATASAAIEERYHGRKIDLEAAAGLRPDDPSAWLALAHHLDEYAYAGVLDPDRQTATMLDAHSAYEKAERLGADDPEGIRLTRGRLLLRLGRLEEAEDLLATLFENARDPGAAMWRAECLFRLGRFEALRQHLDHPRLAELAVDPDHADLGPAINLWQISDLIGLRPELDEAGAS